MILYVVVIVVVVVNTMINDDECMHYYIIVVKNRLYRWRMARKKRYNRKFELISINEYNKAVLDNKICNSFAFSS